MKLFVYGTLKRGWGNHSLIKEADGKFLYKDFTKDKFCLSTVGFPYMFRCASDCTYRGYVLGEVYLVPKTKIYLIDALEGHPEWYNREIIELQNGDKAWAYIMPSFDCQHYEGEIIKPYKDKLEF